MISSHIYYLSDAYSHLYPANTHSNFKNDINENSLAYLPPFSTNIEAAINSISFSLFEELHQPRQIGIRTNIMQTLYIRGSRYDNVMSIFAIPAATKERFVYSIPSSQHVYFKTTKELLTRAHFELFDLSSSDQTLSIIDRSLQQTVIEVIVRPCCKALSSKMLVESSDRLSLQLNPKNNNMNFTIALPEIIEVPSESRWSVSVKAVQLTGKIWNIQDESFTYSFQQLFSTGVVEDVASIDITTGIDIKSVIPPGYYNNRSAVTTLMNEVFKQNKIPIEFKPTTNETSVRLAGRIMFDEEKYHRPSSIARLILSNKLAQFLGYEKRSFEHSLTLNLISSPKSNLEALYSPNIYVGLPTYFFIHLNILETQVVGHSHFPVLQLLYIKPEQYGQELLNFELRENNIAVLKSKVFTEFQVKITDINGKRILAEDNFPTIIHLNFTKW